MGFVSGGQSFNAFGERKRMFPQGDMFHRRGCLIIIARRAPLPLIILLSFLQPLITPTLIICVICGLFREQNCP
jgi:hypothetical protein